MSFLPTLFYIILPIILQHRYWIGVCGKKQQSQGNRRQLNLVFPDRILEPSNSTFEENINFNINQKQNKQKMSTHNQLIILKQPKMMS